MTTSSTQLQPNVVDVNFLDGGPIKISYGLIHGPRGRKPSESPTYCAGFNPNTNEQESNFSTQDSATLEVTVHNHSNYNLHHVRLSGVRIYKANKNARGEFADTDALPDGNAFFEIVPGDCYYGRLPAGMKETKYLALVTRGVAAGDYLVGARIFYDIEDHGKEINLVVPVRRD